MLANTAQKLTSEPPKPYGGHTTALGVGGTFFCREWVPSPVGNLCVVGYGNVCCGLQNVCCGLDFMFFWKMCAVGYEFFWVTAPSYFFSKCAL